MARAEFEGRVAVVTGGAQGIGLAVVERLLAGGATVSIWDCDADIAHKTATRLGLDVQVADQTDPNAMVAAAAPEATLGPMDKTAIFDQIAQKHINFMLSKIPRGRFLKVAEAAAMIGWLCSAENSFTTGAVFDLSGGRATY